MDLFDFDLFLEELGFGDVLGVHGFEAAEGVGVGFERRDERTLEGFELGPGLHGAGWETKERLDACLWVALRWMSVKWYA